MFAYTFLSEVIDVGNVIKGSRMNKAAIKIHEFCLRSQSLFTYIPQR